MNFERPQIEGDSNELPLDKKLSKRDFLKTSLGAMTSVVLTKGIVDIAPKFEESKEIQKESPVFVRMREPMLKDDEFLEEDSVAEEADLLEENAESNGSRESVDWKALKKMKPDLKYERVAPPLKIENLRLPNDVSRYGATTIDGKIIRTLRYKNVTDAVEARYNLPPGILLAMIMEESTGVDLLPNARGDGGFGLCHMQGSTATEFGLKTFCECNALVCDGKDGRSCKDSEGKLRDHAGELALFMKNNSNNRKALIEADERLHIILNIDAAGRMLAMGISGPKLSGSLAELGPLRRAVARYAGAYNYKNYWADICKNIKDLEDPEVLQRIEKEFNAKNPNLKINGERADFKQYMQKFQEQHLNYGLEEYTQLPKYAPRNSAEVLSSYKEFI